MASNPRRIMIAAAAVNVLMWIGAIFLESKYSLALVIATLIITGLGATLTIWNSDKTSSRTAISIVDSHKKGTLVQSSRFNEPLPDPMDFDIEMPLS
jgi:hypothetical protein